MDLHIFDFDGTLIDSSHRYRLGDNGRIDLEHWRANEWRAFADGPLPTINTFRKLKAAGHFCAIATARVWCENSELVCSRYGLEYDHLTARQGPDDTRGGVALKLDGLRPLFERHLFESVHVWEDNLAYLGGLCLALDAHPHYIPSNQGH